MRSSWNRTKYLAPWTFSSGRSKIQHPSLIQGDYIIMALMFIIVKQTEQPLYQLCFPEKTFWIHLCAGRTMQKGFICCCIWKSTGGDISLDGNSDWTGEFSTEQQSLQLVMIWDQYCSQLHPLHLVHRSHFLLSCVQLFFYLPVLFICANIK